MDSLTSNPVLGHINTFGGHPVCCAAGFAAMNVLLDEELIDSVKEKEQLFLSLLSHPKIKKIRSCGLMIAIEFENAKENRKIIDALLQVSGDLESPDTLAVFTDWFLFAPQCLRIVPPLTISDVEIKKACNIIITCLDNV